MTPLLEVRDLSVGFATRHGVARAVDHVSFEVAEGETLGIVGESGSGKTVTALALLRLLDRSATIDPQSVIAYKGRNILDMDPEALRQVRGAEIAMVFQEPAASLNPVLTVGTQITETLHAHRSMGRAAANARAVELLDLVGIPDSETRFKAYPHELSGGMQQRVMIAIALSCEPGILVADEPTTALDVTIQAQILELLTRLRAQLGMAMILITHDLGVVAGITDRIAVMYGGQIIEEASTHELFDRPAHPYTRAMLEAVPRLDAAATRLPAIPGAVPPATDWPSGCRFHPRCPHRWDKCVSEAPSLDHVSANHRASCWLVTQPQAERP